MPCVLDRNGVVLTQSGRASILLALEALGTTIGTRVLVPTYHCPTMVSPVHTLGAEPLFYPLNDLGAPDLTWLSHTGLRGVRAMIVAHYFGLPQPMDAIAAWCRERGIAVIEDCAHALFGQAGARPVGAWGSFAVGSLKKFLPVADGGCLVANDSEPPPHLTQRALSADLKAALDVVELGAAHGRLPGVGWAVTGTLRLLRNLRGAAASPPTADNEGEAGIEAPDTKLDRALSHSRITRTSRWLVRRLPRGRIVERRRRHYASLADRLATAHGMHPLVRHLPEACAPYVFPLWVERPDPGYQALRQAGVPVYRWNQRWPGTPDILGDSGSAWSHHVLQIGCHQDLSESDVIRIADLLLNVFGTRESELADAA